MTSAKLRRGHGDQGAAVVEMAFVGSILFLLIFGIIAFGFAMSVQQNLRQAAAEGARAAAVETNITDATAEAQQATETAVGEFGYNCTGHMSCTYITAPCPVANGATVNIAPQGGVEHCIKVHVKLDTSSEWFANIPLVNSFMPDELNAKSVIRINTP